MMLRCTHKQGAKVPIFHFHVVDGETYPDSEGIDLPDIEHARIEAIERSQELLKSPRDDIWDGRAWKMIVTDAYEHSLFILNFLVSSAPLTQGYGKRLSSDQSQ